MRRFRVALAQLNPTVGDLEGNREKAIATIKISRDRGVDLVVFPELFITGYPPEDLLFKPSFIRENEQQMRHVVEQTDAIAAIIGFAHADDGKLYNAAAVAEDGNLTGIYHKIFLT